MSVLISRKFRRKCCFFSRATSLSRRKCGFRRSQFWDPGWPHGRFLKDFLGVLESTDSRWANPIEFTGGKPWEVFPIIPQTLAIFSVYLVIENGGILNWFLHEIKIQIFQIKTVIFKNILTHGHWLKSVIKVARFWGVAPISDGHARQIFRQCVEQLVQRVTLMDNVIVILDTQEPHVINVIHPTIVRVVFVKVRNSTILITFCNWL